MHRPGLIEESEVAAQIVLLQVREQHIGLPGPGLEKTLQMEKARLTGLLEELLEHPEPGVAPRLDHEIGLVRSARDHQRLHHALGADGSLDAVVLGIGTVPGVVVVGLDFGDRHSHQ